MNRSIINRRSLGAVSVFAVVLFTSAARPAAAATTAPSPLLQVAAVVEDGQPQIKGTLTVNGKPVEGATLAFGVRRTFGLLALGEDKTLDDGTAEVKFPRTLPGAGPAGTLSVLVTVKAPDALAGTEASARLDGGTVVRPDPNPFPRAMWGPSAPLWLQSAIIALMSVVWGTYAFVAWQLIRITTGGSREQSTRTVGT